MSKAVCRWLSFHRITELGLEGRSSQVGTERGDNSLAVREVLATGWSMRDVRQSVKLIVLIILIEYDYQVVSKLQYRFAWY